LILWAWSEKGDVHNPGGLSKLDEVVDGAEEDSTATAMVLEKGASKDAQCPCFTLLLLQELVMNIQRLYLGAALLLNSLQPAAGACNNRLPDPVRDSDLEKSIPGEDLPTERCPPPVPEKKPKDFKPQNAIEAGATGSFQHGFLHAAEWLIKNWTKSVCPHVLNETTKAEMQLTNEEWTSLEECDFIWSWVVLYSPYISGIIGLLLGLLLGGILLGLLLGGILFVGLHMAL